MGNSIIFKIMTLFLNFIFYKILTDRLSTEVFGEIIYFFSISLSISILSNLGSDTIVSKKNLKSIDHDILEGKISYEEFHIISIIIGVVVSPIISFLYGIYQFHNIFIILFVSLSLTHAKIFSSNFLPIKSFFFYYYFSIFGFLLCVVISVFIFNSLFEIFLLSCFIFNLSILLINIRYKFLKKSIFFLFFKINLKKIIFTLKKSLPFVIILFLASSHEIIGQYWLSHNYNYSISGYAALLFRIASLVVLGLAALNLVAYSTFNNKNSNFFNDSYLKEYFKIFKISFFFSIFIILGIYLFHNFILKWFNLPYETDILISLFILIIGQFLVICLGPISMAMTQFDKQRVFASIYILGCLINIIILLMFDVTTNLIQLNPLIYTSLSYSLSFVMIHLFSFCFFFLSNRSKIHN